MNKIPEKILKYINQGKTQTPYYIYDKEIVRKNINCFLEIPYQNKSIYFATMANSNIDLKKALAIGFGIRCNLDTFAGSKKTLGGIFIGKKSRLGLNYEEILSLKGNQQINMLHLYPGTDILDIDYFISTYSEVLKITKLFPNISMIDFGGGFGVSVDKVFNFKEYGEKLSNLLNQFSADLNKNLKLILEPGRIIGADAGFFVTKIEDIKIRGEHQFIGVNSSSVQFPRPLFYPDKAFHRVSYISKNTNIKFESEIKSSIYGCSTYSRDFLAKDIELPNLKIGDLIILEQASSYCATAHTNFLGFEKAEEIFVS